MDGWAQVSIVDGPLFVGSYAVTALLLLLLLLPVPGVRIRRRRFLPLTLGAVLVGALAGGLLTWLLSDVFNVFGVSLTAVVRWADAIAFAGFAVALVNLLTTRWWRALIAVVAGGLTGWCLFLTINVDFGQYPTVGDALGLSYQNEVGLPQWIGTPGSLEDFTAPADLPQHGVAGSIEIPAVRADFAPRRAAIYLPPAAFADEPPALPVVIAMSGQPGTPTDVFSAGGVAAMMDSIAAEHSGVAPIVVVPDQLADPATNPMCVDGALGDSATYLTVDVPEWISANLPASTDRTAWTVAGFSQGGTCAIQLGAGNPTLFGSILDVSGEVAPTLGDRAKTVEDGFGGDAKAYDAAVPAALLERSAPYPDTTAIFVAGQTDAQYSGYLQTVSTAAEEAGMSVSRAASPATGHDWNTARFGFAWGFDQLLERWGVSS